MWESHGTPASGRARAVAVSSWGVWLKDSAHKAERPRLCGRGRSSLFSIYLTWLQYAANYHKAFDCPIMIARSRAAVKPYKEKREALSRLPFPLLSRARG